MKLIFAGTPEFAATALDALLVAGHEICLVLTQPDRPAGRGMHLKQSAVKMLAVEHSLPVVQPDNLKNQDLQSILSEVGADAIIVAAYGLLLPEEVLVMPRYGCINIHASLLPRWRGAAPIQRAIEAGDAMTGISIMQMDVGLDTGDILATYQLAIESDDTSASLTAALAKLGAIAIVETLANIAHAKPTKQPEKGACYAAKVSKAEGQINWGDSASNIAKRIRAFNPLPGASTTLNGKGIKIWQAHIFEKQGNSGQVLELNNTGVIVATGDAALCITELQSAGGKRLAAKQFISGKNISQGDIFGT